MAFVGYCSFKFEQNQQRSNPAGAAAAAAPAPTPALAMPVGEAGLCEVLDGYSSRYAELERTGANEIKRSSLRSERAKALGDAVRNSKVRGGIIEVTGWVGTLEGVTTTGNRSAAVTVKLPCGVSARTWNNTLSDVADHTLIPSESPIYAPLAELRDGSPVVFDGEVFLGKEDGLREISATESGSMTSPELLFRFKTIAAK